MESGSYCSNSILKHQQQCLALYNQLMDKNSKPHPSNRVRIESRIGHQHGRCIAATIICSSWSIAAAILFLGQSLIPVHCERYNYHFFLGLKVDDQQLSESERAISLFDFLPREFSAFKTTSHWFSKGKVRGQNPVKVESETRYAFFLGHGKPIKTKKSPLRTA